MDNELARLRRLSFQGDAQAKQLLAQYEARLASPCCSNVAMARQYVKVYHSSPDKWAKITCGKCFKTYRFEFLTEALELIRLAEPESKGIVMEMPSNE